MNPRSSFSTVFLLIIMLVAWFAIITQFRVHMQNTHASQAELAVRYFSFFTTLSNLLIAVACTSQLLFPRTGAGRFFSRPGVLTALAVYIFIVALIYNTVLRFQWNPTGLPRLLDELVHVVDPVLYIVFWLTCVPKQKRPVKDILPWLIFPLAYIVYTLIRGSIVHFYPYSFVDVAKLGMNRVLLNCIFVAIAFVITALLFLGLNNLLAKRRSVSRQRINA